MATRNSTAPAGAPSFNFSEAITMLEAAAEANAREGTRDSAVAALRDAITLFRDAAEGGAPNSVMPPIVARAVNEQRRRAFELRGLLELLDASIDSDNGVLAIAARMAAELDEGLDSMTLERAIKAEREGCPS